MWSLFFVLLRPMSLDVSLQTKRADESQELRDGVDSIGISERNKKCDGSLRVSLLLVPLKAEILDRHEVLSCERTYESILVLNNLIGRIGHVFQFNSRWNTYFEICLLERSLPIGCRFQNVASIGD